MSETEGPTPAPATHAPARPLVFRLGPKFWPATAPEEPRSMFGAVEEILKRPYDFAVRYGSRGSGRSTRHLAVASMLLVGVYGLASAFFQGGPTFLLATLKAPIILLASYLICLPSLYIFACLSGSDVRLGRLANLMAGSAGMAGLFLLGMAPIAWLFSVSSASVVFAVIFHLGVWLVAAYLGLRFLFVVFHDLAERRILVAWSILFVVVSFQVATLLRPILVVEPDEPLVAAGKKFFVQHFVDVVSPSRE